MHNQGYCLLCIDNLEARENLVTPFISSYLFHLCYLISLIPFEFHCLNLSIHSLAFIILSFQFFNFHFYLLLFGIHSIFIFKLNFLSFLSRNCFLRAKNFVKMDLMTYQASSIHLACIRNFEKNH